MAKEIILFQGGTHGNFLERYLNVGCRYSKNFDFYKNRHGAHADDGYKQTK